MLAKLQTSVLGLYLFSMPFQNILKIEFLNGTLTKYLGLLLMGITTWDLFKRKKFRIFGGVFFFGLFVLHCLLLSLFTALPSESLRWVFQLTQLVFLNLCLISKPYTETEQFWIRWSILGAGLISSAVILFNFSFGITTEQARFVVGTMEQGADPNHVAAAIILPFLLTIGMTLPKLLKAFILLLLGTAMLLTGSRGGLAGLGIGLMWLFLTQSRDWKQKGLQAGGLLGIVFIFNLGILTVLPEQIAKRFSIENLLSTGGSGRWDIWQDALGMSMQNPFLGYGYGLFDKISRFDIAAHNIYIQLLVETGLIGFTLFFLFLMSLLRQCQNRSLLSGAYGMLAASCFLGTIGYPYFWLSMCLPILLEKQESNIEKLSKGGMQLGRGDQNKGHAFD